MLAANFDRRADESAIGGKADIVRRPKHTFKISLHICEVGCVRARPTNVGPYPCSSRTTSTMYRTQINPGITMAIAIKDHIT